VKHRSTTEVLSPPEVEAMFDDSGIRHRILIVSACFSGVFADALANPSTLVITAADAQHPSFGCRNGNEWTYFGRAFFADSLQHNRNLKETFAKASRLIAARETKMRFPHSNPQMTGGERILAKLGQGTASDPAPADREKSRARCVLKVEALPDNTECQVFNGYSAGKRIGAFRIADRKVKSRRIGVAAGGTCPSDFLKGEMLSTSKVRAGRAVYTLTPDCRSAVKTTQ
jgi:hypothetical protein